MKNRVRRFDAPERSYEYTLISERTGLLLDWLKIITISSVYAGTVRRTIFFEPITVHSLILR